MPALKLFGNKSVDDTAELQRIMQMPRRVWTDQELEDLADRMTLLLKTPGGTMKLRPAQALALHYLWANKGLAALMRVGSGKSLVSFLAPYMVGAKRPVLLLPATLINKTNRDLQVLKQHWRIQSPKIISYEMLGRVQGADLLNPDPNSHCWRPDFVGADEVHKLKHRKVARTRRVDRFMTAFPDTVFAGYSGTFMKHGLRDFWHILKWCLKDEVPVPRTYGEVCEWADAIDEKVPALARRGPGALLQFCSPEEKKLPPLQAARLGFQRRLIETPGIVTTPGYAVACSLVISALPYSMDPKMEALYTKLRGESLTPDDWDLMQAMEVWRVAREMAAGFHYVQLDEEKWKKRKTSKKSELSDSGTLETVQKDLYARCGTSLGDYRPPQTWRVCRKVWAKFVRDQLAESDNLDSELQVKNACARGELPDLEYKDWMNVEPTCSLYSMAVWHDEAALKVIEKWMSEGPGLVWVEHAALGKELARRTGAEYYRQDGMNDKGQFVEDADCSKAIIVSVNACKEGKNLQGDPLRNWKGFSRNLVTAPMSAADDWEQLIGRTHRDGQQEDEVTVDFLLGCKEHWTSWVSALAGAVAARDTLGAPQKLLLADIITPTQAEIDRLAGSLWKDPPKKRLVDLLYAAT